MDARGLTWEIHAQEREPVSYAIEMPLKRRMTDLARWVYSRHVPLRLVLKIYEISCRVGSCLLQGKFHL